MDTSAPSSMPSQSAIPPTLFNVCFVLCVINLAYFPTGGASRCRRWRHQAPDPIRLPAGGGHLYLDARNRLAKRHE